jgi:hypothetical protein
MAMADCPIMSADKKRKDRNFIASLKSEVASFNWGQSNINFQSARLKAKGADNNWGQININFFDSQQSMR